MCPCQMALLFIEHLAGSLSRRMVWTLSFSACDALLSCVLPPLVPYRLLDALACTYLSSFD